MDLVEPAPLSGPTAPRLPKGSTLATVAADLLARHTADDGDTCRACGEEYPCAAGTHAAAVLELTS